jgi:hypothetical protein
MELSLAAKKLKNIDKAIAVLRLLPANDMNARSLKKLRRDRFKLLGECLEEAHAVLYRSTHESVPTADHDAALAFIAEAARTLQPDTRNYN